MDLTRKEFFLAIAFAFFGFVFSMREFILFLNSLNPITGLLVYYAIIFVSLLVLSKLGLTVFDIKIEGLEQVIGLTLITFAFFLIVNWESPYVQLVTQGSVDGASNVFFQAEDGATWFFWNSIIGFSDIFLLRLLTFVFSPFLLVLVGGFLASKEWSFGG